MIAPDSVRTVTVVGSGVIGTGWAAYFLARGLSVRLMDSNAEALRQGEALVRASWPSMEGAGIVTAGDPSRLSCTTVLAEALEGADYVQENGPEDVALKIRIIADIERHCGPEVVIGSSSSSLLPSDYQAGARYPGRILAAHPFNPPSLIPLVEIAGGRQTAEDAIVWAMAFFTGIGKAPVRVLRESEGYIANRMTAALYREAVDLVVSGVATVADVDAAISNGPGLRWALMGPHLIYHLAGGPGGYRHYLDHLGSAQERRWASLRTTPLSEAVKSQLVEGLEASLRGRTYDDIVRSRDADLVALLKLARDRADGRPPVLSSTTSSGETDREP